MKCTVFYSWQSDLANSTNRGFIQKALELAAKSIRDDDSISVEPVIDRDTADVPGAPDISGTIFSKIDQAQVFVADVSIVNRGEGMRPSPNPNVLIELGYAVKSMGWSRVVMLMNLAYGPVEDLPFDLRHRRVVAYNMPHAAESRAPERTALQQRLTAELRTILSAVPQESLSPAPLLSSDRAIAAIEASAPNQGPLVRTFMEWVVAETVKLAPDFSQEGERDDLLVQAIDTTTDLVTEFARVAQSIAAMDAREAGRTLYKGFEGLLSRYYLPKGFSGGFNETDFDFYKFIGHELFVTLFSLLIREERWELIADLLDRDFYVENISPHMSARTVRYHYVNKYLALLDMRNKRLSHSKITLHGELLNERHQEGQLAELVPMRDFAEADYFLFLRSEVETVHTEVWVDWVPWTVVYWPGGLPRYLAQAERKRYAERKGSG